MLVTDATLGAWSRLFEPPFQNKMNSVWDSHVLKPNSLQQVEVDSRCYPVAGFKQTSKGIITETLIARNHKTRGRISIPSQEQDELGVGTPVKRRIQGCAAKLNEFRRSLVRGREIPVVLE